MNKQNVLVTIFLVSVTLISMIQATTLKTRNQPDSISYASSPTIQNLTELYNRSDIVIHGVVESSRIETPRARESILDEHRRRYVGKDSYRGWEYLANAMMKIKKSRDPEFTIPKAYSKYIPDK